ncbi:MAG: hypothetical protein GY820_47960 [Gammaproteobacteria bacterium]|nr:hypothetical protein [Gammaproteobacteria bacterium]
MNRYLLFTTSLLLSFSAYAKTYTIPDQLIPWKTWVIEKHDDLKCPLGSMDYQCTWSGKLGIIVNQKNIVVAQTWETYKDNVMIPLPGSYENWPVTVRNSQRRIHVIAVEGKPFVKLKSAGRHSLEVIYKHDSTRDFIAIPAATPIIDLMVYGEKIFQPQVDQFGNLYFSSAIANDTKEAQEDRVTLDVFRLLDDSIPFTLTSRLEIRVSGSSREITLSAGIPTGFQPVSMKSQLPVRIEGNSIRTQVKPGVWTITIRARAENPVNDLSFFAQGEYWPANEIWVFRQNNALRQVELKGLTPIDPQQTRLPDDWKNLPAFIVKPDSKLDIIETKRGNPTPSANQLSLNRLLWLDFDAKGYSVRDSITGEMNRDWRLNAKSELELGRVNVNNQGLFITYSADKKRGVELRSQHIDLIAESQIKGDINHLSATGWDAEFSNVHWSINMPPGWSIFTVSGVDKAPGTWINQWTLLDLFFLLVISAAVSKLWNWKWGLLAAATLVITTHDYLAPYWVWPNLIAAAALLRVIKHEKMAAWLTRYRLASIIVLVVISLPYMVKEIRTGIYPQLDHTLNYGSAHSNIDYLDLQSPTKLRQQKRPGSTNIGLLSEITSQLALEPESGIAIDPAALDKKSKLMPSFDPDSKIQTGPGMPEWIARYTSFSWSGPVDSTQEISITYISPAINLLLAIFKVLFITFLGLRLIEMKQFLPENLQTSFPAKFMSIPVMGILTLGAIIAPSSDAIASSFPTPELLNELEQRLTEKNDCLPYCANIQQMLISANHNELIFRLNVHSELNSYITLPVQTKSWQPEFVLVNDKEARLSKNGQGFLMVKVDEGDNDLIISGDLSGFNSLALPVGKPMHNVTVVEADGWEISGVSRMHNIRGQLKLTRIKQEQVTGKEKVLRPSSMPDFLQITRTISIGLNWEITTHVQRLSGGSNPIIVEIPLITGESVTTHSHKVDEGVIKVEMAEGQRQANWSSTLDKMEKVTLKAPSDSVKWIEVWNLNVSPIWRVSAEGIPEINHKRHGRLGPMWRPWPGESLMLNMSRPQGVKGQTLTVRNIKLSVEPGDRLTNNVLSVNLLASQGGQHVIKLPENSRVKSVTIDNKAMVVEQDNPKIELPIHPRNQTIEIKWSGKDGIGLRFETPEVDLGLPSVNTHISVMPGNDRWALFLGGPSQGPAILFWGVMVIVTLLAIGLGRISNLPIRTTGWLLLGAGLMPVMIESAVVVAGWMLFLKYRGSHSQKLHNGSPLKFNFIQAVTVILTLGVAGILLMVIEQGLLGTPNMQIAGNNSWYNNLHWYQDRGENLLSTAWLISVPMYVYRILMLLWALWLAITCLKWVQWGWKQFSKDGVWRTIPKIKSSKAANKSEQKKE